MKFVVYYGQGIYGKGQTGKQAMRKLLTEKAENKNNKFIIPVSDNKEAADDRV